MAEIRANFWGHNFWESQFNTLSQSTGRLNDQLWSTMMGLSYVTVTSETNTKLTGRIDGGGTITVHGRNFDSYYYDDVVITRMVTQGTGADIDISGTLYLGGYLDFYGTLNNLKVQSTLGNMTGTGQYEYDYYGYLTARNVTETTVLPSGQQVISKTDSAGDFVSHVAKVSGHELSINGRWSYDLIDRWEDIFTGNDLIYGTDANDYLQGFSGNDTFYGGGGTDTVIFRGNHSEYRIESKTGSIIVSDTYSQRDGTNVLLDIERFAFNDGVLALDVGSDGVAGKAYRIYQAAFDRTPDSQGLGFWIHHMDQGLTIEEVAVGFMQSAEFMSLYGISPTNDMFIMALYQNVLGRPAEEEGFNWWMNQMNTNPYLKWENVLVGFSESHENQQNVLSIIGDSIFYDLYI